MLSENALKSFKEIYLEEFGREISDDEATELGTNLLTMFNHIYKPVKKDWLSAVSDSENEL